MCTSPFKGQRTIRWCPSSFFLCASKPKRRLFFSSLTSRPPSNSLSYCTAAWSQISMLPILWLFLWWAPLSPLLLAFASGPAHWAHLLCSCHCLTPPSVETFCLSHQCLHGHSSHSGRWHFSYSLNAPTLTPHLSCLHLNSVVDIFVTTLLIWNANTLPLKPLNTFHWHHFLFNTSTSVIDTFMTTLLT